MPGFFQTARRSGTNETRWSVYTARPVLVTAATVSSTGANQGSSYSQDIYFDDTLADGSGFAQSLETLVARHGGPRNDPRPPPRRRRPPDLDVHLPTRRPPRAAS